MDNDYKIEVKKGKLQYFSYPTEDFISDIKKTETNFLIGGDDFWHNGVHIHTDKPIKNIMNGKVVAYRLCEDYKKEISIDNDVYDETVFGFLNSKYSNAINKYFDNVNGQYKMRNDLTE